MKSYIHIAQRVYNTPLLIHPAKLQVILHALRERLNIEALTLVPEIDAAARNKKVYLRTTPNYALGEDSPLRVVEINGSLVNRYATGESGVQSYDEIRQDLLIAASDPTVRGVMLRLESYGGEATGVADMADAIRAVRQEKRVWASVDASAYSAAYFLASQAERIYVTRDGGVGSVGVIAVHYDFSGAMEKAGIKPTAIFAGKQKTWFSPDQPIAPEAVAWLQAEVDRHYAQFVAYVAEGRSLSEERVRTTEAGTFTGEDAVEIGFADAVGTFEQALEDLSATLTGAATMTTTGGRIAAHEEGVATMATTPAAETANQLDHVAIAAAARTAERGRIRAILTHTEAAGREQLAQHLAFETDTEAAAAGALLAAAPKATASANNAFAKHMAEMGNPKVGTTEGSNDDIAADIKRVLAA